MALRRAQKVNRLARLVYGAIKIILLAFHLDIRLVHAFYSDPDFLH